MTAHPMVMAESTTAAIRMMVSQTFSSLGKGFHQPYSGGASEDISLSPWDHRHCKRRIQGHGADPVVENLDGGPDHVKKPDGGCQKEPERQVIEDLGHHRLPLFIHTTSSFSACTILVDWIEHYKGKRPCRHLP